MTITIALSIDRILESIYAYSALDYYTTKNERPAILGRDEAPILRQLINNCAASLIIRLSPLVVDSKLDNDDIITIDLDIDNNETSNLRNNIETILTAQVLSIAWAGESTNLSNFYANVANKDTEALIAKLRLSDKPGRIEQA